MPSITVRIPDSLRANGYIDQAINTSAKARLVEILARPEIVLEHVRPAAEVSANASFWVNVQDLQRLEALGAPQNLTPAETVTALLVQAHRSRSASAYALASAVPAPKALARALAALKLPVRPEQARFYAEIQALARTDQTPRVLFAEAGTGIGKTLCYEVLLHEFLSSNRSAQCAISVPSHALMDKVLRDWHRMLDALRYERAAAARATVALLGQGEFVSEDAISGVLDELAAAGTLPEEQEVAIRRWISQDGPPAPDALTSHRWTVSGLRSIAPEFAHVDTVTLASRSSDDDRGFVAYRQQWEKVAQASLVVMTHAMLASVTRRRLLAQAGAMRDRKEVREAIKTWHALSPEARDQRLFEITNGIYRDSEDASGQDVLPGLQLLVVDEAHQLEDAFAMVLTQQVSIWGLAREVRRLRSEYPAKIKAGTVEALERIFLRMRERGDADSEILGEDDGKLIGDLNDALADVAGAGRGEIKKDAGWRRVNAVARTIQLAHAALVRPFEGGVRVMVDWSPDRRWPRLSVGRTSFAREMHYLWTVVAERSLLVSGTLYEEFPQLSFESARRALSVPFDASMRMTPVHAAWQYSPTTVCVVSPAPGIDGRSRFVRPKAEDRDFDAQFRTWIEEMAQYLVSAHRVAAGGMLVLGTAFRDVDALATALRNKGIAQDLVLAQDPGRPLAALRLEALRAVAAGRRPILIGVGGAWTGFDLHLEGFPNAFTDLAILNAPFGVINRTLARAVRTRKAYGQLELIAQVTMLVRQGVGRLVRSPETPHNRRIHWLDARIHESRYAGMFNPIKRVLSKYKMLVT
jgi:CRISPR type IV-associated DEAD/DEAH-box helicase Csf4